ncbi:thioesterase II family protein [Wukongibacter sp. M2B1]|uniref:thioesterase II family protein n=1 Tax=Wukongibacter sp. M2B1 TaxID=3088895 RepID=UPI003D7B1D3A
MDRIKLFCIPYAGGSATAYREWKKHIHPSIELCPIELAGRDSRFGGSFYEDVTEAVDDIYNIISKDLDGPYAIFGHSMGSVLAYELAHKIKSFNHTAPIHLFFSGRRPPHIERDNKDIHLLSDKEFMDEIMELGGTPKELLENKELLELFMPMLRADFKIVETYEYVEKNEVLDCNITVLWGKKEEGTTIGEIVQWRRHTDKSCKIHMFNGGHFFVAEFLQDIVHIINSNLQRVNGKLL